MYNPPTFMTMGVLAEVLSEFDWPAPYTLEDDLPDGIVMQFPACHLFFSEGFESHMVLIFPSSHVDTTPSLTLGDALTALRFDPTVCPQRRKTRCGQAEDQSEAHSGRLS